MAFPTTGVLDDFNRANSTGLGANWTADPEGAGYSNFDVNTNQAKPNASAFSAAYWSAASFAADQEVFATLAVAPANACRIYARIAGVGVLATEDNYELEADNVSSYISKTVNGTRTFLASMGTLFVAGDQMGLACVGNQIIAYKNGVEIGRVTDSSNTAGGFIAIVAQNDTTVRFDNFGGGAVVVQTFKTGSDAGSGVDTAGVVVPAPPPGFFVTPVTVTTVGATRVVESKGLYPGVMPG